jgi:hypothetical protein
VVEATCQTVVTRLPALVACGTRMQTMADALATSIAATRPTISSWSSTSTCWPAGTDRPPPITGRRRAARGLGWDTETLTGVLVATVRDPAVGPRRQTQARPPTAKDTSASAGNPTHFHASTASHKGYFDSGEIAADRVLHVQRFTLPGSTPRRSCASVAADRRPPCLRANTTRRRPSTTWPSCPDPGAPMPTTSMAAPMSINATAIQMKGVRAHHPLLPCSQGTVCPRPRGDFQHPGPFVTLYEVRGW